MRVYVAYFVIILGAIGALVHSLLVDPTAASLFSPAVKAALGLVGLVVATMLPAIQSLAAAKAAAAAKVPPLPALFVLVGALLLAGCKALTPSNVHTVENVVDFVEQDACVLATDFASTSDVQTVATVCGYVEAGTQAAEDVLNRIVALQKSKAKAREPAFRAKYAAKLAALKGTP